VIRLWKVLSIGLLAVGVCLFSIGCGGSGGTQVRLMNAFNGQSSLNLLVNNSTIASGVGFGAASGYAGASSGSQGVQITAGSTTLLNVTLNINGGSNNTVLATLSGATVFADNKSTPPSNDIQIRAINASSSLGSVDVYIVAPNTDLSSVKPNATLAFQQASSYVTLAAGSYQIEFTQTGSKLPIVNTGSLSFSAGQIRTVVSLDGHGFSASVLSDLN
jgi:Domain of unknown function (DUF4397)